MSHVADIFGDLSSSEEEDEKDVNVLDSEDDASRLQTSMVDDDVLRQQAMDDVKQDDYLAMDALAIGGQDLMESQSCESLLLYLTWINVSTDRLKWRPMPDKNTEIYITQ